MKLWQIGIAVGAVLFWFGIMPFLTEFLSRQFCQSREGTLARTIVMLAFYGIAALIITVKSKKHKQSPIPKSNDLV